MGLFSNVNGFKEIRGIARKTTVVQPDRRWWKFDGYANPKSLTTLYSIGIMDLTRFQYVLLPGILDPAHRGSGSSLAGFVGETGDRAFFEFPIPPQTYELVEPFTTQVVATQDGGKFIESHGSLFKDIRISGTVGLRPRPIKVGSFSGLEALGGPTISVPSVVADFFMKDNRGLDPGEITGFDDIIFLRNLFRAYSDLKNNPMAGRMIGMVWTYSRDGEAWVVEPVSFTTTRDKSSPLSWRYQIQFRTLYLLDATFGYSEDPLSIWQMIRNAIDLVSRIANDIATAINQLTDAVNWLANFPANLIQTVLSAGVKVISAAAAFGNAIHSFPEVVSKSVLMTAHQAAKQLQQVLDTNYPHESAFGNDVANTRFAGTTEPWAMARVAGLRDALGTMRRSFASILCLDKIWETPRQVKAADYTKAYLNSRQEAPFTAGSPLAVGNLSTPRSAREVTVAVGEDIRALAKKYLGDESYWKQLVILNDLKPPYIGATSGPNLLGPGSKILIPQALPPSEKTAQRVINSDNDIAAQSQIMQKYGRDIRLSGSTYHPSLSDLAVSSRGDLELIEGVENVEQALQIKFSTEQGELATHPTFGAQFTIGTKPSMTTIQEFSINVRNTLLSDPRVAQISQLKVMVDGDKIITNSKVILTDADIELPISFAVRS